MFNIFNSGFEVIYFTISLILVGVDILSAFHAFREEKNYSHVLGFTCVTAAVVQIMYLISSFAKSYIIFSVFSSLYFLSITFALVMLLTFVRSYIYRNNVEPRKNKRIINSVGVCLFIDAILFVINPFYEIVMSYEHVEGLVAQYIYASKPLYWYHLAFCYSLVIFVLWYLIKRAISIPREYRRQYLYAVFSLISVVVLNGVFLCFPKLFGTALDYSIWGYSFIAFQLYLNFYRYPINGMKAYYNDWIVQNVNQGVVLFNLDENLNIYNTKVQNIFPDANIRSDMTVDEFASEIHLELKEDRKEEDYSFQFYVKKGEKELPVRFDHRCLRNKRGQILGHLFVFTDEAGDTDILTSFYTWESFKNVIDEYPENFNPPITVSVCDINGLSDINTKYGRSVGDQAISTLATTVRNHFTGESYYIRGREASLIVLSFDLDADEAKNRLKEIQDELLTKNDIGCYFNIQCAVEVVTNDNNDVHKVINQALKGMKNKKLLDVKSRRSELVTSLVKTLAECDNDTEAHVRRTQKMGEALGRRMGLTDMQLSDLALLCILHDIGKIGIPLEILNKPGKLSEAEWRMMRTHTEKGYQIATSSQELNHLAPMILHHHEAWDGRGYPEGLSKESIPLLSRIIAVVDAYDAMISDRVYRPGMPVEDAIKELKRCAGTQFDPGIVNEFISMLPEIKTSDVPEKLDLLDETRNSEINSSTTVVLPNNNVHAVNYSRYVVDAQMRVIEIDENFEKLTGYNEDDIKNNVISQLDLIPEEDRTSYFSMVTEMLGRRSVAYFEHRIVRKDGSIIFVFCYGKRYYDSAVRAERSEVIIFDSANTYAMQIMINEEQNKAEARLLKWEEKYRCDSLTGLLNHEAFKNDVDMRLIDSDMKVMLLMMDVDKFKNYNDTYGHKAGDEFLIMLAQTLTATLRKDDLACRMGGDEFAAALFYKNTIADSVMYDRAQQICDKINMILSSWQGGTSLSMGVVVSSDEIKTFNKMYETSDIALYDAKEAGRARMVIYNGVSE